jgi:hypothetical protein
MMGASYYSHTTQIKADPKLILIPSFYAASSDQLLCYSHTDDHGFLCYPYPTDKCADRELYEKWFLSILNANIIHATRCNIPENVIKAYTIRMSAEALSAIYDMEQKKNHLILLNITSIKLNGDFDKLAEVDENGFFCYPHPANQSISPFIYQEKFMGILKQNLEIAQNKNISVELSARYRQRAICELLGVQYNFIAAQVGQDLEKYRFFFPLLTGDQ